MNVFKSYCVSLDLAEKNAEIYLKRIRQANPVIPPTSPTCLQVRCAAAVSVEMILTR